MFHFGIVIFFASGFALPLEAPLQDSSVFRATHNSYTGNKAGQKGTILHQLDHGTRLLELDIHDHRFASVGDYQVGHNRPGNAVDHTAPNPSTNNLLDWLAIINEWSNSNPTHAPIQLVLDLKDDFTRNPSYAVGNLAALNQKVTNAFGPKLFLAKDAPPDLVSAVSTGDASVMGKVMVVLSGDITTKTRYKSDVGHNPAVARNNNGLVVEVHDDGKHLWYWSGRVNTDGSVSWLRHGKYNTGIRPAVALNDDNIIIEVHQSQRYKTIWCHIGKIDPATCEITWSPSRRYGNGVSPSLAFIDAGNTVHEIHQGQNHEHSQHWDMHGTLDVETMSIAWTEPRMTSDEQYPKSVSNGIQVYEALQDGDLRYSSGQYFGQRIVYEQVCFVEHMPGNNGNAITEEGAIFYAAKAKSHKWWIGNARKDGKLVRGYDFDNRKHAGDPMANYPATNWPYADWYEEMVMSNNVAA